MGKSLKRKAQALGDGVGAVCCAGAASAMLWAVQRAQPVCRQKDLEATTFVSAQALADEDGEKRVFLTFDDGPSPTTEAVLDVLKEKGVPATFFVVSAENNKDYLPLIKRAVEEGHQIAPPQLHPFLQDHLCQHHCVLGGHQGASPADRPLCGSGDRPLASLPRRQHQHRQPQIRRQLHYEEPGGPGGGEGLPLCGIGTSCAEDAAGGHPSADDVTAMWSRAPREKMSAWC